MQETTNNLTWIILGLLAAAVVIAIVLTQFPALTSQITKFLGDTVKNSSDKINGALFPPAAPVKP